MYICMSVLVLVFKVSPDPGLTKIKKNGLNAYKTRRPFLSISKEKFITHSLQAAGQTSLEDFWVKKRH